MISSAGQPTNVGSSSTPDPVGIDDDVADHAELDDRDGRDLRIRHVGERRQHRGDVDAPGRLR